jgi:urease accessory protein
MPVGQSTGLSVQASLESTVAVAVDQALTASLDEIGSATPMLDWLSATHETQYSRLFRS